jgi:hypothetical protein
VRLNGSHPILEAPELQVIDELVLRRIRERSTIGKILLDV